MAIKGDGGLASARGKTERATATGQWVAIWRTLTVALLACAVSGLFAPARAVPSFARQTGQVCSTCHTTIPYLTDYGRAFKMNGYVEKTDGAPLLPIAAMAIAGFTHTRKSQDEPPLWYNDNTNDIVSLDQISVFYAGQIAGLLGAFVQVTYDPAEHAWAWDNLDVRAAKQGTLLGEDAVYGLSLNNSPMVQDIWMTSTAWGYPAFDSAVAPQFGLPGTLLQEGLAGQVMGLTGYTLLNDSLYLEAGGYLGLSQSLQSDLGSGGDAGNVVGVAPYARATYSFDAGPGSLMLGTTLLAANLQPGFVKGFGTDNYVDLGFDAQYDFNYGDYGVTLAGRDIVEWSKLKASLAEGDASRSSHVLNALDLSATVYKGPWAGTAAMSNVSGTSDGLLYSDSVSGSPAGTSLSLEVDWSPFMDGGPKGFETANLKLGLKYSHYLSLYGGSDNFDGAGHDAADNDTLFFYLMGAF